MPKKEIKEAKKKQEEKIREYFKHALKDPHTRIEFIRKKDRTKQGVMISFKDSLKDNSVLIGFSLCNLGYDYFDYLDGFEEKDFGKWVAFNRARKYSELSNVIVYSFPLDEKKTDRVYIPQTVHEKLGKFIQAAYKYYKGADFPLWVIKTYPKEIEETEEIKPVS